jgi:hypothetical protein
MKFQLSEEWLRRMAEAEDVAGCINIGPPSEAWPWDRLGVSALPKDVLEMQRVQSATIKQIADMEEKFPDRRWQLRDGEPCSHPGCLKHVTHPCEGCGRVGGRTACQHERLNEDGVCRSCGQDRRINGR